MLEYVTGRTYSKNHLPRGKAKTGLKYKRELRNEENVPESHVQLKKFLFDQNKELHNFIQETTEHEQAVLASDIFNEVNILNEEVETVEYVEVDDEIDCYGDEEVIEEEGD